MTDHDTRYRMGLRAGYCEAGTSPEYADDEVYRLGYVHGREDFKRRASSFLPCPERPSQGGHDVAPPQRHLVGRFEEDTRERALAGTWSRGEIR